MPTAPDESSQRKAVTALISGVLPIVLLISTLNAHASAQEPGAAAEDQDLRQALGEMRARVDELEEQQAKLTERLGSRAVLQAYTARDLDLGGHVTSLFSAMHGDDRSRAGHVVSVVELYLKAQLDEDWSLFATPGFYLFNGGLLDDPATPTRRDPSFIADESSEASVFLARMEAQWHHSDALSLSGGVIGTPHGTTNREYFIPARTIALGSLHTRALLENALYPQQIVGLRAAGKHVLSETGRMEYDAYLGVQDSAPDRALFGLRLAYEFTELGLNVAANYGSGRRSGRSGFDLLTNVPAFQSPFPPQFNGARDYGFVGLDVQWRLGDFVSKAEFYQSAEDGYLDQRAASTELTWFALAHLGISYRFDYYDRGSDQVVVATSPSIVTMPLDVGHATEHLVGLCYDPCPSVRLRLDFHHLLMPRSDAVVDSVNLSWSLSF